MELLRCVVVELCIFDVVKLCNCVFGVVQLFSYVYVEMRMCGFVAL